MNYLDEDELFDLFEEKDFSKIEDFVKKYGINAVDRDGRDLLMNFIIEGDKNNALKLINAYKNQGLNINNTDFANWTPLHFAVQEGMFSIVEKLIESGALINEQEEYGRTPLFIALFDRLPNKMVKYLVEHGADIDIVNNEGICARQFLNKSLEKWIKHQC